MNPLVYVSSASGNTHRFVDKLTFSTIRIPISGAWQKLQIEQLYILLVPSYGSGSSVGSVPIQVIHFLNNPHNRSLISGVIDAGNTNFGKDYCLAGKIIAQNVRYLTCIVLNY